MLLLRTASGGFIKAESIVGLSPQRDGNGRITWAAVRVDGSQVRLAAYYGAPGRIEKALPHLLSARVAAASHAKLHSRSKSGSWPAAFPARFVEADCLKSDTEARANGPYLNDALEPTADPRLLYCRIVSGGCPMARSRMAAIALAASLAVVVTTTESRAQLAQAFPDEGMRGMEGMRGRMMHRMMHRSPKERCEERLARRAGVIA